MKKKIILCSIILLCLILFYFLIPDKKDSSSNGFKRIVYTSSKVVIKDTFALPNKSFGFLWEPTKDIWLMNFENPLVAYEIDYSLKKMQKKDIPVSKSFNANSPRMSFDRIDSTIFCTDKVGNLSINTNKNSSYYSLRPYMFDAIRGLSENSVVTRGWDTKTGRMQTVLNKITFSGKKTTNKLYHLPKQVDGFFCTDGKFIYDQQKSLIFYMFYHRGEFLCLDTNLNLLYKAKTIDTIKLAKIKFTDYQTTVINGKEVKNRKLAAPLEVVQRSIATDNDFIYVHSNTKADNDSLKMEPIDVYLIKNGKYLHSFYLPKLGGYRLRDFKVKNQLIIGIYDKNVVTFRLYQ